MFPVEDGVIAFPVVFKRPDPFPVFPIIGGYHAPFPAGGDDLVLAEGEGTHVPDTARLSPFILGPVSLGAIFDHDEPVRPGQLHYRIHITRPAG